MSSHWSLHRAAASWRAGTCALRQRGGGHRWLRRLFAVMVAAAAVPFTCPGHLQTSRGDDRGGDIDAGPSSQVDWRVLPPVRGRILDRSGAPLAARRAASSIYVIPRLFTADVRTRLIELLALGEDEVARIDSRLSIPADHPAGRAVLVLADQSSERAGLVAQAGLELGGAVEVHEDSARIYPNGAIAAHVIGHIDPDAAEPVGRRGIEQAFERKLHGQSGVERFVIDEDGERMADADVEALIAGPRVEPPVAGHDVVLTLDLELQRIAEKAVAGHAAAAVVVAEPETGRVLALVSTPSFDPNIMSDPLARAERERLDSDPRQPFVDRTLERDYAPGSTYKLVTAVAGLESGMASPREKVTCTGQRTVDKRVLRDMHAHGTVDFLQALEVSCNVYFWTIAERVGIDRMAQTARDLGFGAPTGLGINDEVPGRVPDSALYGQASPDLVPTLNAAVGSGDVKLTAIQLAMAYAAVANGGRLYAPQIVRRVLTASGQVVEEREPVLRRAVAVSQANLRMVRQGMLRAVNAASGTAFRVRKGAVKMAGKTGTAVVVRGRPPESARPGWDPALTHAWFVGWAPWDRPQIVVVVFIEHGGVGGVVAAPVARKIVDGYFTRVLPRSAEVRVSRIAPRSPVPGPAHDPAAAIR